MSRGLPFPLSVLLTALLTRQGLGQRLLRMSLLWVGLGNLVGAASVPADSGHLGLLSFLIAGVIVFTPLGLLLGLLGGQVLDSALGAAFGVVLGAAFVLLLPTAIAPGAFATCVMIGGLMGATFGGVLRMIDWIGGRVFAR